jgi:transcription elongation factor SPT6
MSMRDLIDGDVEVDEEENDESFDEETGESRPGKSRTQNRALDDDSSEEEDDDDEEAAREVWRSLTFLCSRVLIEIFTGTRGLYCR